MRDDLIANRKPSLLACEAALSLIEAQAAELKRLRWRNEWPTPTCDELGYVTTTALAEFLRVGGGH